MNLSKLKRPKLQRSAKVVRYFGFCSVRKCFALQLEQRGAFGIKKSGHVDLSLSSQGAVMLRWEKRIRREVVVETPFESRVVGFVVVTLC